MFLFIYFQEITLYTHVLQNKVQPRVLFIFGTIMKSQGVKLLEATVLYSSVPILLQHPYLSNKLDQLCLIRVEAKLYGFVII